MTPGASVLKAKPRETVAMGQVEKALAPSAVLLEYVMAGTTVVYRIDAPDVVVLIVTVCDEEYVPAPGLKVGVATLLLLFPL